MVFLRFLSLIIPSEVTQINKHTKNKKHQKQANTHAQMGPFIDSDHPIIQSGVTNKTHKALFKEQLEIIMQQTETEIILIPSLRDVQHDLIFPQPSFIHSLGKRYVFVCLCLFCFVKEIEIILIPRRNLFVCLFVGLCVFVLLLKRTEITLLVFILFVLFYSVYLFFFYSFLFCLFYFI
jgi:hypothetical protein